MGVGLSGWLALLLWPGMMVMDWLARTWPALVIQYGVGFTAESYVHWSIAISLVCWSMLLLLLRAGLRRLRTRSGRNLG